MTNSVSSTSDSDRKVLDGARHPKRMQLSGLLVALVLLLLISRFAVTTTFFQPAILSVLTPSIGILMFAAIGEAIVIGSGGIDLVVPGLITIVGQIIVEQSHGSDSRIVVTMVIVVIACLLVGIIDGILIEVFGLSSLIVTLAMSEILLGTATVYRGQIAKYSSVPPVIGTLGTGNYEGISYALIAAIGIAIVLAVIIWRTVIGRQMVMNAMSKRTSQLAGFKANRYRVGVYAVAALFYGAAATVLAGLVKTPTLTLGQNYLLTPITAAVLSGMLLTGDRIRLAKVVLGAAFLTILTFDLQVKGYSIGVQTAVQGAVLVIVLASVLKGSAAVRKIRRVMFPETKPFNIIQTFKGGSG